MVAPLITLDVDYTTFVNDDTLSSTGQIIYSTGALNKITNNGSITSTEDDAIVVTKGYERVVNAGSIFAAQAGIVGAADYQLVTNTGNITADNVGVKLAANFQTLMNIGDIHAETGIAVRSNGDHALLANSGLLMGGSFGIRSTGDYVEISNNDRIVTSDDTGTGIVIEGAGASLANNNMIGGGSTLLVTGDDAHIVNNMNMFGQSDTLAAIRFEGDIDTTFINRGWVLPMSTVALSGADGHDTIRNRGTIGGNVELNAGDDTFDNRGGSASTVYGGEGNDSYYTGNTGTFVEAAGEGTDTVYSEFNASLGANFERLVLLGDEDAQASGNNSRNVLIGNSGDNTMWGGGGRDFFVFLEDAGNDTIADFGNGTDRIDLSDIEGVTRLSVIKQRLEQVGNDLVLDLTDVDGGFQLTLQNTDIGDLQRMNFIF